MFARSIRTLLIATMASLAVVALPAAASASVDGASQQISSVDAVASNVATGTSSSTSSSTSTSAKDSPTVSTYSGGGDKVPPPVDCNGNSTSTSTSTSTSSSDKPATDNCLPVTECSAADTDGKDANGKPCVECSKFDTDGKDASGQLCVPTTTVVTETPCTDDLSGGGSSSATTTTETCVSGGGEVPVEEPITAEPVVGGGTPEPAPSEAVGGGAPELPFTGLPLWYAIYAGLGLMLLGGAFWARGHFGGQRG